jgi:hypothetical protein
METKFIEDTNEQYSIREDGAVISHYRKHRVTNEKINTVYKDVFIKIKEKGVVHIYINDKSKGFSIRTLTLKYFGFTTCKHCNDKIITDIMVHVCKKCKKELREKYGSQYYIDNKEKHNKVCTKWRKDNPEKALESVRKYYRKNKEVYELLNKKRIITITKSYVSSLLNIPVKDLSDDVYNMHKSILIVKRKIADKFECSIHKIK